MKSKKKEVVEREDTELREAIREKLFAEEKIPEKDRAAMEYFQRQLDFMQQTDLRSQLEAQTRNAKIHAEVLMRDAALVLENPKEKPRAVLSEEDRREWQRLLLRNTRYRQFLPKNLMQRGTRTEVNSNTNDFYPVYFGSKKKYRPKEIYRPKLQDFRQGGIDVPVWYTEKDVVEEVEEQVVEESEEEEQPEPSEELDLDFDPSIIMDPQNDSIIGPMMRKEKVPNPQARKKKSPQKIQIKPKIVKPKPTEKKVVKVKKEVTKKVPQRVTYKANYLQGDDINYNPTRYYGGALRAGSNERRIGQAVPSLGGREGLFDKGNTDRGRLINMFIQECPLFASNDYVGEMFNEAFSKWKKEKGIQD